MSQITTLQVMLLAEKSQNQIYSELFADPKLYLDMFKSIERIAEAKNTDIFEVLEIMIPWGSIRDYFIEKLELVALDIFDHCENAPIHKDWIGADEYEQEIVEYNDSTDYARYELAKYITTNLM